MKDFKHYLYNEVPMPLEDIPNTKWDPEIYKMAQEKAKGNKKIFSYNPLRQDKTLKEKLSKELNNFFEKTIASVVGITSEDVDYSITNKVAFLVLPKELNADFKLLMSFYYDKTDLELLEKFNSGDEVKALKNKLSRKIKNLSEKLREITKTQKKLFNSNTSRAKTQLAKVDQEVQFLEEEIDELEKGLKEMNSDLKLLVGDIVEKWTKRSSVTEKHSSIRFELEPIGSFYRSHFPAGLPSFLKGGNLGYKLYIALANKLGVIFSARNTTPEAKAIWLKLLSEAQDFYAFFLKNSALRGIILKTSSDAKIKAIVEAATLEDDRLVEKNKNYEQQATVTILYKMLAANKVYKPLLAKLSKKIENRNELVDAIKTLQDKTKDPKEKANVIKLSVRLKGLKINETVLSSYMKILRAKDFFDEVKDPDLKKRLETVYAKDFKKIQVA
jgi:hypothetical protein